ncbi:hypothetical protein BVRB_3g053030 [Beta vulgaris subsp. vulgaris]|nr:hypothetical protein BVRB_3g053030 [Beta vulgaris subsp. vulgaris]
MSCNSPNKTCHRYLLFLLACHYLLPYYNGLAAGITTIDDEATIRCLHNEREALLEFKHDIRVDRCGLLSSWGDDVHHHKDCCRWQGVQCNNRTSHVTMLALRGPCLEGTLSASLIELNHLKYLDLSLNDFRGQLMPSFIDSLANLRHLDLSEAGFTGEISHHLGNLSNLLFLDLSCDSGNLYGCPYVNNLNWLSHLSLLRDINLNGIDLSQASDDWFQVVTNLPSLRTLHMKRCWLSPIIPSTISHINSSTTLSTIDLSNNNFNDTSIFKWLFNLNGANTSLVSFDLSYNQIPGSIPHNFGEMLSLSYLDLSSNQLDGPIPRPIWNMHNISFMSLGMNQLEGPITNTISNAKHLTHLILSGNNFHGSGNFPSSLGTLCYLQEIRLNNNELEDEFLSIIQALSGCASKSLVSLDLSNNRVWGSIPNIISSFSSLNGLYLSTNQLNGTVSQGIGQLSKLERLDMSYNSLKGTISHTHLSNLSRLNTLDLSNNLDLVVDISAHWIPPFQLNSINLESCKLGPSFPKWLVTQTNVSYLGMSNAEISDSIPSSFWNSLSSENLEYLNMSYNKIYGVLPDLSITFHNLPLVDLSSNDLHGAIPSFLRNTAKLYLNNNRLSKLSPFFCPKQKTSLLILNLANNLFSGEISDCLMYFDQLLVLHLENNNFSSKLPVSIGALKQLSALHLYNNSLSGELPRSLERCTSLNVLNLGYNMFTGHIPLNIGHNLTNLGVLILRGNSFYGSLPLSLCQLSHLKILDVSINHINGVIPKCINNFTAMTNADDGLGLPDFSVDYLYTFYVYSDYAELMWKRKEQRFQRSLTQVKGIDISDNELEGEIPQGISSLNGLIFLNLSRNHLKGSITSKIGMLTSLEFLDLSNNHLSEKIPTSLSQVTNLAILDLSNNNLSGKIPVGTQLQGFDPSSYMGNSQLCGAPLSKCPGDEPPASKLCGLQELDLSSQNLPFEFSVIMKSLSVCSLNTLETLDLSNNMVWGSIPDMISSFSSLKGLLLYGNRLNGTISQGIGQLSMLEELDFSSNTLSDTLTDKHLANLSSLRTLSLSENPELVVNVSSNWVPPFQLDSLTLGSCKLGPHFPEWLKLKTTSHGLTFPMAEFQASIPVSFWKSLPSKLQLLDVSRNSIYGTVPEVSITFDNLPRINMSTNQFSGTIPSFLVNASMLYLDNNKFSNLTTFLCPKAITSLTFLDLSNNLFSGELPDCWMYFDQLATLYMDNNHISGNLPTSTSELQNLQALHLRNNSLSGETLMPLENCSSLVVLDLGYNSLTGHIPREIGNSFQNLSVLILRSNEFVGDLPSSLCQLSRLQILDLSSNLISGTVPACIYNLTAMTNTTDLLPAIGIKGIYASSDSAKLMWKRQEQSF